MNYKKYNKHNFKKKVLWNKFLMIVQILLKNKFLIEDLMQISFLKYLRITLFENDESLQSISLE